MAFFISAVLIGGAAFRLGAQDKPRPPEPTSDKLRSLIINLGMRDQAALMLGQYVGEVTGGLKARINTQFANAPSDMTDKLAEEIRNQIDIDQVLDLFAGVCSGHLTEEDIDSLTAFYQTPVGRKWARTEPVIRQEVDAIAAQWGHELAERTIKAIEDKGIHLPEAAVPQPIEVK